MINKVEGLRTDYNESVLLDVAEEYAGKLKAEGIEINMYFEAIDEATEEMDAGKLTVDSLLKSTVNYMENYDVWLESLKNPESNREKIVMQSVITGPVYFLQLVYIFKHEGYTGNDCLWDFAVDHNKPFAKAIGLEG